MASRYESIISTAKIVKSDEKERGGGGEKGVL